MSLLGSALGRALAGGSQATAHIASRYIDEQLLAQRAQALADIQHANMVRADQHQNSPERRELMRKEAGKDVESAGAAETRALIERTGNTGLRQAEIDRTNAITKGTVGAKVEAENEYVRGTSGAKTQAELDRQRALMPGEISKATQVADATARAHAKYREPRPDGADAITKKVAALEGVLGRKLKEDELLRFAGIAKKGDGEDSLDGLIRKVIDAEVENNRITADEVPAKMALLRRRFNEIAAGEARMRKVAELRAQGKGAEAMSELIAGGATDDDLRELGFSADEIKNARPGKPGRSRPNMAGPPEPNLWDRAAQGVRGLISGARAEGSAYQSIQRRAQEARAGGPPLTPEERETAKRYGVAP